MILFSHWLEEVVFVVIVNLDETVGSELTDLMPVEFMPAVADLTAESPWYASPSNYDLN